MGRPYLLRVSMYSSSVRSVTENIADPATGKEIGTIPEMGKKETAEAIDVAYESFQSWKKTTAKVSMHWEHMRRYLPERTTIQQRHDLLMKLYALMQEHSSDLARILVCFSGSPNYPVPNTYYRPLRMGKP